MRKFIVFSILVTMTLVSVHAQGLYLEVGPGFGKAWTTIMGGNDISGSLVPDESAVFSDFGTDLGLKIGIGPLGDSSVYIVLAAGGLGHTFHNSDNFFMVNTYYIGPGIIYYPFGLLQMAASFGYSFNANQTDLPHDNFKSSFGLGGDISLAFDLGFRRSGILLGIRGFAAFSSLEASEDYLISTGLTAFVRYALRRK
jgi:hypothetical protein